MKHALVSDIHGNLEALTAVLTDIEKHKVDFIHCLGDVVGYGPDPAACLKMIDRSCDTKLMGNHEFTALGLQSSSIFNNAARAAVKWTQMQLTDNDMAIMADFEMDRMLDNMYLVHASPLEPEQWHYVFNEEEAVAAFQNLKTEIGFMGHSHLPLIFSEGPGERIRSQAGHTFQVGDESRYLINVGSVGQPRDNDRRACYVVFDTDEGDVFYHRVEYDIDAAQQKMATAGLPEVLISRLAAGL